MEEIKPQAGPQTDFLSSSADIVIYGGGAGGGKTFGILLDPLRDIHRPGFGAVIFRREREMVTNEGGLLDESMKLYPAIGGKVNLSTLTWSFPGGGTIGFGGLKEEYSVLKYQGSQIAALYFDELTHFTEFQFWYMLSRNRTTCGIRPRVRATLNPDPGSWVFDLLGPWVNPEHEGIKAVPGQLLYIKRVNGKVVYLSEPDDETLSMTWIPALLSDNPKLMENDPDYERKLKALPEIEQRRLLYGEWVADEQRYLFSRDMFPDSRFITPQECPRLQYWYRGWDTATGNKQSNDPTATAKVAFDEHGNMFLRGFQQERLEAAALAEWAEDIIERDGPNVFQVIEAHVTGYTVAEMLRRKPAWKNMYKLQQVLGKQGDKRQRALPWAMRAREKKVYIVMEGDWQGFKKALFNFTGTHGANEDDHLIDAISVVDTYLKENKEKVDVSHDGFVNPLNPKPIPLVKHQSYKR